MAWSVKFDNKAEKELYKLDLYSQKAITNYLYDKVLSPNPKVLGKPLSGDLKHLWRYRVDKFRLICEMNDNELIVLVVKIAHRKELNS